MQAIMYLLKRTYINKCKRAFSSVLSAIITVVAVLGLGASFVFAFSVKRPNVDNAFSETFMAGMLLLIGVILYNSFLSRDNGILTMADANFFFTGPFEKRAVLAYILISTAPASVFTAFFMCFYFPFMLGSALTAIKFIITLLIISLLFGCIYLSYYYMYIIDIDKPGLKKNARTVFLAFVGVLVAVFVVVLVKTNFNFQLTAKTFFTHYLYNFVPLFGWAKWAISSLIVDNILLGFIPATALLIVVNIALCIALYNVKTDFYEKTLEDSFNLQKLLDDKKANGNVDVNKIAKLKNKVSNANFKPGAAAIYSRQQLEDSKLSFGAKFRDSILGLFYIVFGLILNLDFSFVITMIAFSALTMSLNGSWHREFKKPYIFLIPAKSFNKLILSILPGLTKTLLNGGLTIVIAALIYKVPPRNLFAYLIIFASFIALFIFAEVLTYRMIGSSANIMAVNLIRMLFAVVTCIPALIVFIVIMIITNEMLDLFVTSACMLFVNLAMCTLLAFLSRGIFENSEIME